MRQAAIFTVVGLLAGIALASWVGRSPLPALEADADRSDARFATAVTSDDEIAARLAELERRLAAEVERRVALEATVTDLTERLGPNGMLPLTGEAQAAAGPNGAEQPSPRQLFADRRALRAQQQSPEYRRDQLISAGFAPDQAQWIVDREAQSRMDLLNAQYTARREGEPFDPLQSHLAMQVEMRQQLGDAGYEQYLEATGQPTNVRVFEVLQKSPGYEAGLRSGDEIVAYGGERVFSLGELNDLTVAGNPGETVAVDIMRDGQAMQIYIPRGPIGISGGGFLRGPAGAVFGAFEAIAPP